jgi:hypothetical protein
MTKKRSTEWMKDRIYITIHPVPGLPDPVFAAINGKTFAIKPGEEVFVPKAVLQVLNDATVRTSRYIPHPSIVGQLVRTPVVLPRFAVSSRDPGPQSALPAFDLASSAN